MPDIKGIIDQLQHTDIKSIDIGQLQEELMQRKDFLVNIGVVIISFIILFNILGDRSKKIKAFKEEITLLEEKSSIVEGIEITEGRIDNFLENVATGLSDVSSLINKVNEFALKNGVQIISVIPQPTKTTEYSEKASIDVSISASSYKNIGMFIYDIETCDNNLRIEKWSTADGSPRGRNYRFTKTSEKKDSKHTINASLLISSITIIKEKI